MATADVWAFARESERARAFVMASRASAPISVPLPPGQYRDALTVVFTAKEEGLTWSPGSAWSLVVLLPLEDSCL